LELLHIGQVVEAHLSLEHEVLHQAESFFFTQLEVKTLKTSSNFVARQLT
jgi:hypothetical protein